MKTNHLKLVNDILLDFVRNGPSDYMEGLRELERMRGLVAAAIKDKERKAINSLTSALLRLLAIRGSRKEEDIIAAYVGAIRAFEEATGKRHFYDADAWKVLIEGGNAYRLRNGTLESAPLLDNGNIDYEYSWGIVTEIEPEDRKRLEELLGGSREEE